MAEPGVEAILAYLRENSGRFSLGALRHELLQDGYDAAAVDQAIELFRRESPVPDSSGMKALRVGLGAVMGLGCVILLIIAVIILAAGGLCAFYVVQMNKGH